MTADRVQIALRAWSVRRDAGQHRARVTSRGPLPVWPGLVLILDTETTADAEQQLLFGSYRLAEWTTPRKLALVEEGLFYADDLPQRDPAAFACLEQYARTPNPHIPLLSRSEFVERLFFAVGSAEGLIVGFNLPFDLSRLATSFGKARGQYRGGFSLNLAGPRDSESSPNGESRSRPRVVYRVIDSKRALIGFTADLKYLRPGFRGRFLDLKTLAFALTGKSYSLARACKVFGVEHPKTEAERHGDVTPAYIDYNRRDVLATQELLEALRAEFDRHPIDLDPCRALSPASLAKGYLRALGVRPPRQQFRGLPPAIHGVAMLSYYGGRAEARIRRTPVPVVLTDFLSMYPTVNSLMDNWGLLTAERIEITDITAEARQLLETITVEALFDPAVWSQLRFFAHVEPCDDILPVRAPYGDTDDRNIGINYLTSDRPLWYAGPDLVASILLTGRPPRITHAIRLDPHGRQDGLSAARLRGSIDVDPRTRDFFRTIVEAKTHAEGAEGASSGDGKRLGASLKLLVNAGSYGILSEQNRKTLAAGKRATVTVHGLDGPFSTETVAPEEPGEYCFFALGALITAAARLMLALLERGVRDAGGSYAFCDTDSMAIVATPAGGLVPCDGGEECLPDGRPAIRALSSATVDQIARRFTALNPYDRAIVPRSILKIEKENFDDRGVRREIFALVISAKRYCLFTCDRDGEPIIVKPSEHGLGHLLNPTDPDSEDRNWMRQFWDLIVRERLGRPLTPPVWLDRPAISRWTITTPEQLAALGRKPTTRGRAPDLRPANFILTAHVAPLGHPPGADASHFHLMAAYERDPTRWLRMPWVDVYSGTAYRISTRRASAHTVRVKSYRDVLTEYVYHPEPKSAAATGARSDRQTIGLLGRRHMRAAGVIYIGKESNKLEDVNAGLVHDPSDVLSTYLDPHDATWERDILPALKRVSCKELARTAGVSERTIKRIRNGHQKPSARVLGSLLPLVTRLSPQTHPDASSITSVSGGARDGDGVASRTCLNPNQSSCRCA